MSLTAFVRKREYSHSVRLVPLEVWSLEFGLRSLLEPVLGGAAVRYRNWCLMVLGLVLPGLAFAVSFDCAKAQKQAEFFVCSQEALSVADDHVARLYSELSPRHPELRSSQLAWIIQRNKCDSPECVHAIYKRRLYALILVRAADAGDTSLPPEAFIDGPSNTPEARRIDAVIAAEYAGQPPVNPAAPTSGPMFLDTDKARAQYPDMTPDTPAGAPQRQPPAPTSQSSPPRPPGSAAVAPVVPPPAPNTKETDKARGEYEKAEPHVPKDSPAKTSQGETPADKAEPGFFTKIGHWIANAARWLFEMGVRLLLIVVTLGCVFLLLRGLYRAAQRPVFRKYAETHQGALIALATFVVMGIVLLVAHRPPAPERDFYGREIPVSLGDDPLIACAIAFAAGLIAGAFFSDAFRPVRKLVLAVSVAGGVAWAIYASPTLARTLSFIAGFVIAWSLLREVIKRIQQKRAKLTTFGSAEWADYEHLVQHKLIGEQGMYLGHFRTEEGDFPLQYAGPRHLLTVAPTRAGKGVSAIIPNLLNYRGSALVVDPKGENALITIPRRGAGDTSRNIEGMGQEIFVVDPWGITGYPSACFNPLDWLKADDPEINENAMILSDSIVVKRGGNDDAFWDEEAKALLMGLILYVATDPNEEGRRNLGRVRDIIVSGSEELKAVYANMYRNDNSIVGSTAARTESKEEKLRMSVFAALQSHTHFLDSPRIRESLSRSDFQFEDLKSRKITVYLVLPADRLETFGRWLRLLVQQAITVNARNIQEKPEQPILFMLDEMAALDRLKMVEQAYGLMAGFGMQIWGIVQDLSQLERIYGKGWQTFIGNSGVLQYYGSRDHKTADYFSKLCGVTTIEKFSFTRAIARAFSSSTTTGPTGGSSTSGNSTTYSDSSTLDVVQRHLAYPDELMVMRQEEALILVESFNPIRGKKVTWYDHPVWRQFGINLHAP